MTIGSCSLNWLHRKHHTSTANSCICRPDTVISTIFMTMYVWAKVLCSHHLLSVVAYKINDIVCIDIRLIGKRVDNILASDEVVCDKANGAI